MRRATATLGTITAAAMFTLVYPLTAVGATGTFAYSQAGTRQVKTIKDPTNGLCYKVAGDGDTRNSTNARVELYSVPDCGASHQAHAFAAEMQPGDGRGELFQSVESRHAPDQSALPAELIYPLVKVQTSSGPDGETGDALFGQDRYG